MKNLQEEIISVMGSGNLKSQSKSIEKKLAKKQADLDAAVESRRQIEQKIKVLREEIETLQSTQLEQVFQQVKKSVLKEGLRLDAEAIPGILQSIRESQEQSELAKDEPTEKNLESANLLNDATSDSSDGEFLPQEEEIEQDMPTYNGSRLP